MTESDSKKEMRKWTSFPSLQKWGTVGVEHYIYNKWCIGYFGRTHFFLFLSYSLLKGMAHQVAEEGGIYLEIKAIGFLNKMYMWNVLEVSKPRQRFKRAPNETVIKNRGQQTGDQGPNIANHLFLYNSWAKNSFLHC